MECRGQGPRFKFAGGSFYTHIHLCACPICMVNGLDLYVGSQSICFMGFCVSYYGWSYARQTQIQFYFLKPFSFPHRIAPLLPLSVCFLLLILFPELPTIPLFSFSSLIYSSRLVEELWLSRLLVGLGVQFHCLKVGV